MHFDPRILRVAVGLAGVLLFGGGLIGGRIKDSIAQTSEGLVFRSNPLSASAGMITLPIYILFFASQMNTEKQLIQWVSMLLVFPALAVAVAQMPGTITLTPTAITQRFWFRPSKTILYSEVMAIQLRRGGNMTRVLGDNRVKITHISNHRAATEFQEEIKRSTGMRVRY
jgi:hypothetical protein